MRRLIAATVAAVLASLASAAPTPEAASSSIPEAIAEKLSLDKSSPVRFVQIAARTPLAPAKNQATPGAPQITKLEAAHAGDRRIVFRSTFASAPDLQNWNYILYLDLDNNPSTGRATPGHEGTDVMLIVSNAALSASDFNPAFANTNSQHAGALDGESLYMAIEAPVAAANGAIPLRVYAVSERKGSRANTVPWTAVSLPLRADLKPPAFPPGDARDLRTLADYRYHDKLVRLEKLTDKGLTRKQVEPAEPRPFPRLTPQVVFQAQPLKDAPAKPFAPIEARLLEEAGVARPSAAITFGVPFPQGVVFNPAGLRVLDPKGAPVPAQFSATAFWPDNSVKWALADFACPLAAGQEAAYAVAGGPSPQPRQPSPLSATETADAIAVVTGPLRVQINRKRFNLFEAVWLDRNRDGRFDDTERAAASSPEGIRMRDENGKVFGSSFAPPDNIRIEEIGPEKIVIRAAGPYAAQDGARLMSYVTRLTFRGDSPRVTVQHSHVNTWLETEFVDITSLDMPLTLAAPVERVQALLPAAGATTETAFAVAAGKPFSLFQIDDQRYSLNAGGQPQQGGRFPGAARFTSARGGVGAVIHECWKRWPKAIDADGAALTVSILPAQPSPAFGAGLPHYLLYPFCEGKYRAKWGMAFDTFVTFDFSGAAPLTELAAEADLPVVAVLPQAWLAQTRAIGPMRSAPVFAAWDQYLAAAFKAHMERKDRDREYGYFNYGDWYGERARNWGNNEYDTAHGLFMAFAETGHRPCFRAAQAAARHQAATDIIHAYPDPLFVGANRQHSIGHSGVSYQRVQRATWSAPEGPPSWASNGHTWAGGMMDAWFLTGEARVMESALALAEHITWAMAPGFNHLGTHERSAGWSLAAIAAVYRGVHDPAYLDAARQIAAVALREQRFDKGGCWPHRLPNDHARGHIGAEGNNLFLIGVLLNGLHEYYEMSQDPAVRKSIVAGAEWMARTWDPKDRGWPYSATTDGQALGKPAIGVNSLIMASMAVAGSLTGEDRYYAMAEQALAQTIAGGVSSFGKDLSKDMVFASKTLGLLQGRPGKPSSLLDSADGIVRDMLLNAPAPGAHDLRGPEQKVFLVRAAAPGARLAVTRAPFGAVPRQKPTGSLRLLDASGKPLAEQTFDTDKPCEFDAPLPAGQTCRLVINDDLRGVWNVAGKDVQAMFLASPAVHIGGAGRRSLSFLVPQGCAEFTVRLVGVHTGGFSGAIVAPGGAIAAQAAGANAGAVLLPGAVSESASPPAPREIELRVRPRSEQTGQPWRLCVAAAGDLQCEVQGVAPWLANKPEDLFPAP